jgi:hypothetical protein
MIQLKTLLPENVNVPSTQQTQNVATETSSKLTVEQKRKLAEMVSRYNEYGKMIYREKKITEIAQNLQEISDLAENYALNECGDWFEENIVKRNFQEIKKYCEQFGKLAKETQSKQHQMEALYEDIGHILERYFEIKD